jgi:hypothetical protein
MVSATLGRVIRIAPIVLGAALLLSSPSRMSAAEPHRPGEIARLIDALATSDCRFERNGKWYGAAEAKVHLQRKYDWLRKRDLEATAEQFIAGAASHSSVSGKPYHVQCPGQPRQASADWFGQQLRRLRATAK